MKTILIAIIALCASFAGSAQKNKTNAINIKPSTITVQYSCPMHHDVVSNKPGKCSKCGMDLTLSKKEQIKRQVTNTYTCPMHKEVVSTHKGICAKCSSKLVIDRKGSKQVTTVYTCTMHSQVVSNEKGKCPVCGMSLEKQKNTAGTQTKS